MITYENRQWLSTEEISRGRVLINESPILVCPPNIPQTWKKLAKKVSKIEPDAKPPTCSDTLPPWSSVTINEAIIRLLHGYDISTNEVKLEILELFDERDICSDSPFDSLIKKAKAVILKEAVKVGISKRTVSKLDEVLRILTTKVCVTADGEAVLFRKLGSVQHSCMPNCMFIPRGNSTGQLISIREIASGEPIWCSHIPTNCLRSSIGSRQSWLRGVAGTRCRSDCCTVGFDVRRRVICPKCHPLDNRAEISNDDQSSLCYAARSSESGKWLGAKCGSEMEESEAIDVTRELNLMKKIIFLNEANLDIPRLFQFTHNAISDAIRIFGKGHFCYQQLLLLECGLALNSLAANSTNPQLFISWVRMLVDVYNFSLETQLPFDGMDELLRIVLSPDTLQLAVNLLTNAGSFPQHSDLLAAVATFSEFVEQGCECLVLIEGADTPHSTDGVKLKNWWLKKYRAWIAAEKKTPQPETPSDSFISTQASDVSELAQVLPKASILRRFGYVAVPVGAAILAGVWLYKRQKH